MAQETPKTSELTAKELDAAVGGAGVVDVTIPPTPAPAPIPIPYPNTDGSTVISIKGKR